MKKYFLTTKLILLLIASNIYGQEYFEGQLNYKIEYQPLNANIPAEYLAKEFGDSFTAYVREDRYAMIYHAKGELGWMKVIVRLDEGYSYTEFEKADTISKTKFGLEKNKLIELKRNTNDSKEVLGEMCESITLNYEPSNPESFFQSFRGKYYFNPKYKLNANLYQNYTDGFWNLFVKESESISIRNETEFYPLFKAIQEASSIEIKTISLEMFEPNSSKIISEKL
ncbi:hypothetical protein BFR04_00960 [Gaetbulibacter sp. 4G1]|nr:hypothetical protein [Gaetbulibacter sp. 4G1]PIA79449.1 hypothetical protein BFR04_00960 [Gaetbulibacter sp. 4G1]